MENPAVRLRRLNSYCARTLEGAASLCQTRAHAEIAPEHWLLKLLEQGEGDLHELLRPILRDHFQPALLARFQTVIYRPLNEPAMRTIVEMKLEQVSQQLLSHMAAKQKPHSLTLGWNDEEGIVLAFNEAHGG